MNGIVRPDEEINELDPFPRTLKFCSLLFISCGNSEGDSIIVKDLIIPACLNDVNSLAGILLNCLMEAPL